MAKKQIEGEVREFVDKAEFDNFRKDQERIQGKMLELLEKSVTPAPVTLNKEIDASSQREMSDGFLPPQYQKLFEDTFDVNDGFSAKLVFPEADKSGRETGGIVYTIYVPNKFSNAGEAYLKMYKVDLRSRALQPSNIVQGIIEWNKAVAKNLHYNKNIKTK